MGLVVALYSLRFVQSAVAFKVITKPNSGSRWGAETRNKDTHGDSVR